MTLQQLQYFLATLERGSFSSAAASLRLAQPSVSEQVRALEGELGVRLFARAGRGLVPTEAAAALRPHAERVLGDVSAARDAVAEVREIAGGTATLGMFGSATDYLLTDLAAAFRRAHPGVRLRLLGPNSSEVADAVRRGSIEAGVVVLPIDDEGLDVQLAMRDEVLYVSTDPGHTRRPVTISALSDRPLILYDASYGHRDPVRRQLADRAQEAGVRVEPVIEVDEQWAAIDLAARGLGDTIATRAVTRRRAFPKRLHAAPFAQPLYDTIALITRRDAPQSPATRELLRMAREILEALDRRLGETP